MVSAAPASSGKVAPPVSARPARVTTFAATVATVAVTVGVG